MVDPKGQYLCRSTMFIDLKTIGSRVLLPSSTGRRRIAHKLALCWSTTIPTAMEQDKQPCEMIGDWSNQIDISITCQGGFHSRVLLYTVHTTLYITLCEWNQTRPHFAVTWRGRQWTKDARRHTLYRRQVQTLHRVCTLQTAIRDAGFVYLAFNSPPSMPCRSTEASTVPSFCVDDMKMQCLEEMEGRMIT